MPVQKCTNQEVYDRSPFLKRESPLLAAVRKVPPKDQGFHRIFVGGRLHWPSCLQGARTVELRKKESALSGFHDSMMTMVSLPTW